MEAVILFCPECKGKILVSNPTDGQRVFCGCGARLTLRHEGSNPGSHNPIGGYIAAFLLGAFGLAPFIWTGVGRAVAAETIRRGAGVTKATVEEWLEKGR